MSYGDGEAAEADTRPERGPSAGVRKPRPAGVAEALDRLQTVADRMDGAVGNLRERVDPVLRPSEPSPGLAAAELRDSITSAVADRLHSIAASLEAAEETLRRTADRVDL